MLKKMITRGVILMFLVIALGYSPKTEAHYLAGCDYVLAYELAGCEPGSAGSNCRIQCYSAFQTCLQEPFEDQYAENSSGFCTEAQIELNSCWLEYENCGGLLVDGCWEQFYYVCRAASGIDYCQ